MNESINQVGYKGKFEDKWAQFTERYWLQISISYSNFQWPIVLKYNLIVLSFNFAKTNSTTTFSLFRWLMWSDVPNICLFNWRTGIINFWPLLQTHTQNRMSHLCVMFSWLWFPRCGNWLSLLFCLLNHNFTTCFLYLYHSLLSHPHRLYLLLLLYSIHIKLLFICYTSPTFTLNFLASLLLLLFRR